MRRLVYTLILFALLLLIVTCVTVPLSAAHTYGPPAPALGPTQRFQYALSLVWYDGLLTQPLDPDGLEQTFRVEAGEPAASVAERLEKAGLISDAGAMRTYMIYTGLDTSIQSGDFRLSPALSIVDIARELQDALPGNATLVILPGWRMEEIAGSLPTTGLVITPEDFISAAQIPPRGFDFLSEANTTEGFLYPDTYILPRELGANELIAELVRNFALHLTNDLRDGFARQGLTVQQAVTLASLVQREAVQAEEQPLIASVFLNRLAIGMKLDSDPTVQYALGYNTTQSTWWTNPLSLDDLKYDSPYNTYIYTGLPPTPIANPSLTALRAVAYPPQTPYYFFRAKCDASGLHTFSQTFEEHLQNSCP